MKREFYIKEVAEELSILIHKIELLSNANFLDLNVIIEYYIQEIFNLLFNYKLTSSNTERSNYRAIDLQDQENGIAVQVTSTYTKAKVQKTLNGFFDAGLDAKYDVLLVVILGKKQNTYPNLIVKEGFHFNAKEHIIDFNTILRKVNTEPTAKIERIRNILKSDKLFPSKKTESKTNFRKNQLLKKQLEALLHKNLTRKEIDEYSYMPYRRFIYDSLIIRSIGDRAFPSNDNLGPDDLAPSWYKAQIHDLYEYGIEIMPLIRDTIVVNKAGKWNYLGKRDPLKLAAGLDVITTSVIQRVPYDYMEKLEMETDGYYGYPTLYLEYANQLPYKEEVPTLLGYYKSQTEKRFTRYFEHSDCDISI